MKGQSVKIALVDIENFRGIKSGIVQFCDHTVLIGPNSCGKTTIIEALALVLGRDRLVRNLTEHDFYGSDPRPPDRIRIVATVAGFEPEDFTVHPDWFRDGRGVPTWFDPITGEVLPEKTRDDQVLACQVAFAARFDSESLEVETARYFQDDPAIDIFAEDSFVAVPAKLIRELGFFLIPASRSWDRMLSFGSELFRRVIRSSSGLPAQTIIAERNRLRNPKPRLEEDERLKPVVDEVNAEISKLLGVESPLCLRLTATDSESVLEAVVPHFSIQGDGTVPSKRQGSGLVSLQSLLLLLHFGQKRIEDGEGFCMALEEPELHLPPAIQRRVLSRLQSLSTQTIISTHSPLVAAFCEGTSLLVVRKDGGELRARPMLARPLEQGAINAVRKLFQINRVETTAAMMSEFVLVPEGRLDFDWLSLLLRVVELDENSEEPCLFGVRVGVVPTSDAKVKETCEALEKAHPHICALVDGDEDGERYANELRDPAWGAKIVLRWPDGWMIEDVIGWIIEADEAAVMARINGDLAEATGDRATLVARLKSKDRAQHGMKGDLVACEIIANALTGHPLCLQRARTVLHALAQACAGTATPHFIVQEAGQVSRLVFRP
jgi:energy-coupling factor transporter ATP-binding protein EcfA2